MICSTHTVLRTPLKAHSYCCCASGDIGRQRLSLFHLVQRCHPTLVDAQRFEYACTLRKLSSCFLFFREGEIINIVTVAVLAMVKGRYKDHEQRKLTSII